MRTSGADTVLEQRGHVAELARTVPCFTSRSSGGSPSTKSIPTGSVDRSRRSQTCRRVLSARRNDDNRGTSVPQPGLGHFIVLHQKNTDGRAAPSSRGNSSASSSSALVFTQPAQRTNASASGLPPEASVP